VDTVVELAISVATGLVVVEPVVMLKVGLPGLVEVAEA